jgi:hypothetical protein
MNPIIRPWSFWGWGIDLIGQIFPPSRKGHKFILVATNYFAKWVEVIPLRIITSKNMVDFVKEHIVYHFGIIRQLLLIRERCLHQKSLGILSLVWELSY